tara:strand:+ start:3701 stop:3946 length:246 start_codon:yes stop_codon:yes gene_type:complete
MKFILLLFLIIFAILFISQKFLNSAKRNFIKGQEAWSGKNLNIKYSKSEEISESKSIDNYLKIIADESKNYLEDQSIKEEE